MINCIFLHSHPLINVYQIMHSNFPLIFSLPAAVQLPENLFTDSVFCAHSTLQLNFFSLLSQLIHFLYHWCILASKQTYQALHARLSANIVFVWHNCVSCCTHIYFYFKCILQCVYVCISAAALIILLTQLSLATGSGWLSRNLCHSFVCSLHYCVAGSKYIRSKVGRFTCNFVHTTDHSGTRWRMSNNFRWLLHAVLLLIFCVHILHKCVCWLVYSWSCVCVNGCINEKII